MIHPSDIDRTIKDGHHSMLEVMEPVFSSRPDKASGFNLSDRALQGRLSVQYDRDVLTQTARERFGWR